MLNNQEKVSRKDLKAGKIVLTREIYPWTGKEYKELKKGDLVIGCYQNVRSILFDVNEDRFARDVLYDSINYPILGITPKSYLEALEGEDNYIISKYWNLDYLLCILGYKDYLGKRDLIKLRMQLFHSSNRQLATFLPERVYNQYKECLEELRDQTIFESGLNILKCNSFRPKKEELVRKLKK